MGQTYTYHDSINPVDDEKHYLSLKAESSPFASGAIKDAYMATAISAFDHGKSYVIKKMKNGRWTIDMFQQDVKIQEICDIHCEQFTKILQEMKSEVKFTIRIPFMCKQLGDVDDVSFKSSFKNKFKQNKIGDKTFEISWAEEYIHGDYMKFNNNAGWLHDEYDIPQIFSHYTWVQSSGEILINDLQGVKRIKEYYLTDPSIQSVNMRFGPTDLGPLGILLFFRTHVCNRACKNWPRLNVSNDDIKLVKKTLGNINMRSVDVSTLNVDEAKFEEIKTQYEKLRIINF